MAYKRLYWAGGWYRATAAVLSRLWPGERTLEINCRDVGEGMRVAHGYATVVWASRIGVDCDLYQQVTIGHRQGGLPTIGDRVRVFPGASLLGPVAVGDDAVIGAGSVVLDDVPAGSTVVGVPARVLPTERRNAAGR